MATQKFKRVICKSGIEGWQGKLHNVFDSYEEFDACSDTYGLSKRIGYKSSEEAWEDNPIIQGSIVPSDYKRIS